MHKLCATGRSSVFFSIALLGFALAAVDGARAQTVINPSFELPVAGALPNPFIVNPPTTPEVGWVFSGPGVGASPSESGVQKTGSTFYAPATTDGQQTGWILNLGKISQPIDFQKGGDYELSFKIAAQAGPTPAQPIDVNLDGPLGTFTPTSNQSFIPVTIPFNITAGTHTLSFTGAGQSGNRVAFIDEVVIKPVPPEITAGPEEDLDPYSTVTLTVKHAGTGKGKVRVHFRDASLVAFEHGTSKDNLDLDVPGTWNDDGTITTEQILQASSVGAVNTQTVDITVIAADGQESKAVQKTFHNKAVITSLSGKLVPSGKFNLKGWNFGDAGKVSVFFILPAFAALPDSNGSKTNLDVTVPSWSPAAVKAQFQPITGVMQQVVLITLTTKDGRQSNAWPGVFFPTMVLQQFSYHHTKVLGCSNDGVSNMCAGANVSADLGNSCFGGFGPDWPNPGTGIPFNNSDSSGLPNENNGAFGGAHIGCFGLDSDNGTDVYEVDIKNGWVIDRFDSVPTTPSDPNWENNASIYYQEFPLPPIGFLFNATWHIGATGGVAQYYGWITLKGPKGVPYN
jgi:hypothetical protein